MTAAFQRYMKLRHRHEALSRRVERAAAAAFPVGSTVRYQHGSDWRTGKVEWNERGRVKLISPNSKEVVIDADRLQP